MRIKKVIGRGLRLEGVLVNTAPKSQKLSRFRIKQIEQGPPEGFPGWLDRTFDSPRAGEQVDQIKLTIWIYKKAVSSKKSAPNKRRSSSTLALHQDRPAGLRDQHNSQLLLDVANDLEGYTDDHRTVLRPADLSKARSRIARLRELAKKPNR